MATPTNPSSQATAVLFLGMAGSGKTTLVDSLSLHLDDPPTPPSSPGPASDSESTPLENAASYLVNIDPAVRSLPFSPNIDIRDSISFSSVMSDYSLGPNGAILTSLNLFATRFDQVLNILENRRQTSRMILVDTPGQIEAFTWSASGAIITDALAAQGPTVIVFVVDTPRCAKPMTFVSNMLYACSIMYKTGLPLVVALNKSDVKEGQNVWKWLTDWDLFEKAMVEHDTSYVGTLARSMGMVLEEFYSEIKSVAVSAATGNGMEKLIHEIDNASKDYWDGWRKDWEERKRRKEEEEGQRKKTELSKFERERQEDELDEDEEAGVDVRQARIESRLKKLRGQDINEDEEQRELEKLTSSIEKLNTEH